MNIKELKSILGRAEALFRSSGATPQASDLGKVRDMLDGDDHQSVSDFVAETKPLLEPIELLSPAEIAERLNKIKTDEAAFSRIFAKLETRAVTKEKAIEVASLYLGGKPHWKSKPAALKAIRTSFEDRVYQASKMVFVDKATPW